LAHFTHPSFFLEHITDSSLDAWLWAAGDRSYEQVQNKGLREIPDPCSYSVHCIFPQRIQDTVEALAAAARRDLGQHASHGKESEQTNTSAQK
jgi:hypothetical protein